MRRYLVLITVIVLIAFGFWFNFFYNTEDNEIEKNMQETKCLVQLNISRNDNAFANKNFGDKVKVNDSRFSELIILDATRPKNYSDKGGEQVGKLKNLSKADFRDAAVYLVKNQILKTYWHLGSKVCLIDENTDKLDTLYVAHFTGTHEFCTNECETEELDFRVMMEKDSGFIYLAK